METIEPLNDTEEVTTESSDENTERPSLKQVLGAELQALALEGARLSNLIADAKTAPKKKLYKKKQTKNSKRAAELILYLERLQITEAIEQNKKQQEFIDTKDSKDDRAEGRVSEEGAEA